MNGLPAVLIVLVTLAQGEILPPVDQPAIDTSVPLPLPPETIAEDTEVAEDLEAAIVKLAEEKNEQGKRLLKKRNYSESLALFREAFELDPQKAEVVNNYAYVHALLGNFEDAEKYYEETIRLAPERAVAYLNYSDLLVEYSPEDGRMLSRAAGLLVKARELLGNSPKVILRQARLEVLRGQLVDAERFYKEYLSQRRPTERLKLELGDFFRDLGKAEEAIHWYEDIKDAKVKELADGRLWEMEVAAQSVRMGWPEVKVSPQSERLAQSARKLFNAKKYRQAEALYMQVLKSSPTYAGAMLGYGDLLYRTGRVRTAEMYWLRALVIDRDNPTLYTKLAQLYLTRKNQSQANWAIVFLTRALELRPQWIDLELDLAMALRETGDPLGALSHVKRFLNRVELSSEKRQDALKMKRALETLVPPEDLIDSGLVDGQHLEGESLSDEVTESLQIAKAHLKRGNLNGAMTVLGNLDEKDRSPVVLNLEARILMGAGKTREAVKVLVQSLQKNEKQPIIHEQLGMAFVELGKKDKGRIHLLRAEQLGYTGATYLLAQLDAGELDNSLISIFRDLTRIKQLIAARKRIRSFLLNDAASIYRSEARALNEKLTQRFDAFNAIAALSLFSFLLLVVVVFVRIWGGTDLRRLIARYPDAGIQVQRILSAVRHEVLKHNTMMLVGLVEAMDDDENVASRISHFQKQMLGENGVGGVYARLQHYVNELKQIGDAHKKRLNLKRKDAVTSPLLKGMELVRRNRMKLTRYTQLNYPSKASLKREMKHASALLNIEGYEAVRDLLNQLRTLEVNESLLRGVYEQCKMEPAFAGVSFAPLEISLENPDNGSINVAVPRAAFEDIVTNLIRNAIQSSVLYTEDLDEVEIGLILETEVDMVTGIERAVLLVKDRSPRELTAEMLRGRYIEEGLGLTADLVTRYDGTLDVFGAEGKWAKAVAVKLPVATYGDDT
ncbi:MAG: tetratricopeptide repeat protein [Deltaproteobacteria bacterium]|nr:tetratricopeptide repeat protein [Deltaproteobacteria bacterium]